MTDIDVTLDFVENMAKEARYRIEHLAYMETNVEDHDLCGYCAIASCYLYTKLKESGIDSEIHVFDQNGSCHVFLVVDDYVVDITATQFHDLVYEPVFIMHHKEAQYLYFYESTHVFKTPKALLRWQKQTGWSREQIARLNLK